MVVWTVAAVYLSYWFAYALPARGAGRHVVSVTRRTACTSGRFPLQQTIVQQIPSIEPWGIIALATPIVLALAYASWHFVERPSLRHKPRRPVTGAEPPPVA